MLRIEGNMASTSHKTTEPAGNADEGNTLHLQEIESLRRQLVAIQRVSSLGVLAGGICHELNNALTPILNYAKLGLRNPDPAYRVKAFEKILDAAQRASAITGGVLGLARPRADRLEPTDLVRLAEEVLLLVNKDLSKYRVTLDFRAEGRPYAVVNPAQIQQVMMTLVTTPRRAWPKGGGVRARVGLAPPGPPAALSVADDGVGIAPAALRRIFEP